MFLSAIEGHFRLGLFEWQSSLIHDFLDVQVGFLGHISEELGLSVLSSACVSDARHFISGVGILHSEVRA